VSLVASPQVFKTASFFCATFIIMGGLIYTNFKGEKNEKKKDIARARVLSVTLVTRTVFSPNLILSLSFNRGVRRLSEKKRKLFDANQSFQLREAVVFSHLTM